MLNKSFLKAVACGIFGASIAFIVSNSIASEKKEKTRKDEPKVIVAIGDEKLTTEHMKWIASDADDERVRKIADRWIRTELMYQQAKKYGIVGRPKTEYLVGRAIKKAYAQQMRKDVREGIVVTDKEIKNFYEAKKGKSKMLTEPGKLSFSHIRTKTLEQAQEVIKRIKAGEDINELAKEISIHNNSQRGGWIDKYAYKVVGDVYGKKFYKALLAASEGGLIGPIKVSGGFYEVARHEGNLAPRIVPFDEDIEDKIRKSIRSRKSQQKNKKIDEAAEKLKKEIVYYNPEFFPEQKPENQDDKQKSETEKSVKDKKK
ncbi:MAG: hypothetical protein FVQ80_00645 [Planctomycetes bacterium]|nr:hypothetical protein [Planctomycetota bacterium]